MAEFLSEICWEEIAGEIIFAFALEPWLGFSSNIPTHYLLDHGEVGGCLGLTDNFFYLEFKKINPFSIASILISYFIFEA